MFAKFFYFFVFAFRNGKKLLKKRFLAETIDVLNTAANVRVQSYSE